MKNYHDLRYRDYIIYQRGWSNRWMWQHSSYDGPGDDRSGEALSIEGCMLAIDDIYLDEAHEVLSKIGKEAAR